MKQTYFELNNQLNIPNEKGQIPLEKDKEAVRAYFLEHVNQNSVFFHTLKERLDYLTEENYIDKEVLDKYSYDFIKDLFKSIYAKKFRFQSFMGAYKFYRQYALKTNDGKRYLERYEDRIAFNALTMGDGNEALARALAEEMIERRYQPATPTFLSAGRKNRGEYISCFLINLDDDMNDIGRLLNASLQLSKRGGGVGINLSNLRGLGDPIKGVEGVASGVVPVMKILETCFNYANQLGQRAGSGAVYLNIFHSDVQDFLSTRVENAEEGKRIKMLSLGLVVPDKYYELLETQEYMHVFSPYDVEKVYGVPFSYVDITEEYEKMVANPAIKKRAIKVQDLEESISKLSQESGYPYILNVDKANKKHPIAGKVIMSNLCSEILQVQKPSKVNDALEYETLGTDISCNLGSINIPGIMKSPDFGHSIMTMIRGLTFITDSTDIENVPTVKNGNRLNHTIGLGAMGLHTYLAKNKIHYGSKESIEFVDIFFRMVNFWSLVESNNIAKEKGTFFEFEKSTYADGTYFDRYLEEEDLVLSDKMKELFKGHGIPNKADWKALQESVMKDGLYHQYRLAVAPNGSISYVNETSASLHPIISVVEERQEGKTGTTYYPTPGLNNETLHYFKPAHKYSMLDVINVYASAQKHIDQGMSLTLFMESVIEPGLYPWKPEGGKMTTRDLSLIRYYAWKKGIKTLYYTRTFTEDEETVVASQCESCSI